MSARSLDVLHKPRPITACLALLTVFAVVLVTAPAAAAPTAESVCHRQTHNDVAGDRVNLDVVQMVFWSDCRRFYVQLTTDDAWPSSRLSEVAVEFDLDRDQSTGCNGAEAIAAGIWRADVSTLAGATIMTPSCDENTFFNSGQSNPSRPNQRTLLLSIGKNTLTNDEFFDFRVSITARGGGPDFVGTGWLTASNVKAPRAPAAPRLALQGSTATARWTAPARGDGPIRDYEIDFRIDAGEWQRLFRVPETATGTTTPRAVITSVPRGAFIEARIRAVNAYGYGPWSSTVSAGTSPPMCNGVLATLVGTEGDDLLVGTDGVDVIVGRGGNDTIFGLAGKDVLCGDDGRDRLFGGRHSDVLFGGDGPDRLKGGAGRDELRGGAGNDRLQGNNGNDSLFGGRGRRDLLDGSAATDRCIDAQSATIRRNCEQRA